MEAKYVALSTACKDLLPVVAVIRKLSAAVGLDASFTHNIHCKIHEDNVGALTLARLEPRHMTPRSKHYAIKYHWFVRRLLIHPSVSLSSRLTRIIKLGISSPKVFLWPLLLFCNVY